MTAALRMAVGRSTPFSAACLQRFLATFASFTGFVEVPACVSWHIFIQLPPRIMACCDCMYVGISIGTEHCAAGFEVLELAMERQWVIMLEWLLHK